VLMADNSPMIETYLRFAVTGLGGPAQQATLRLGSSIRPAMDRPSPCARARPGVRRGSPGPPSRPSVPLVTTRARLRPGSGSSTT
jgi:hypothetical protein